ncbi:hypothetical protein IKQ26_07935 [bacterium]|nr:hypothetical protein [bacterium]
MNSDYKIILQYDNRQNATKGSLIKFFRSLGLTVNTSTKARGNLGLYTKNRIDISKDIEEDRVVPTLVHEFAHHIHYKIENTDISKGGTLEKLFDTKDTDEIRKELVELTASTDYDKRSEVLKSLKEKTSKTIQKLQYLIKEDYPDFQRSKAFKEFDKYVRNSNARYLLKYDVVRIREGFFFPKSKILSVANLEKDFPDMPKAFVYYIRLKSEQRKQTKITRRMNKMGKYFLKPTELFARYVQNYFCTPSEVREKTPNTTRRFEELLKRGYYFELKDLFELYSARN